MIPRWAWAALAAVGAACAAVVGAVLLLQRRRPPLALASPVTGETADMRRADERLAEDDARIARALAHEDADEQTRALARELSGGSP